DVVGWSEGAQNVSTDLQNDPSLSASIASTTYLSPGINLLGGQLFQAADSMSFKGTGIIDFGATLGARLAGVKLNSSGATGHSFRKEFLSSGVQKRLEDLKRKGNQGLCTGRGGWI